MLGKYEVTLVCTLCSTATKNIKPTVLKFFKGSYKNSFLLHTDVHYSCTRKMSTRDLFSKSFVHSLQVHPTLATGLILPGFNHPKWFLITVTTNLNSEVEIYEDTFLYSCKKYIILWWFVSDGKEQAYDFCH